MKHFFLALIFIISANVFYGQVKQGGLTWKFKTGGMIVGSAIVENENIYFGSEDSVLYCLSGKTGTLKWKFHTNGKIQSDPLIAGSLVYCYNSSGKLYAIEKKSGRLQWSVQLGKEKHYDYWDYYLASPVYASKTIFQGCGDGKLYAINATTGKLKWTFTTAAPIHATAAVDSNKIYVGSYDGNLYSLYAQSGKPRWKFKTVGDTNFPTGEIQKGPFLQDGVLYFGSRDYNIYAIDAVKGSGHWNMKEQGSWVIAAPLVYAGNIYFGTSDTHRFYCMEKNFGAVNWKLDLNMRSYGSAAAKDSVVYFGCFNGKLYAVHYRTGAINWIFQTDGSRENYFSVFDRATDHFKKGFALYGPDMVETEKMLLTLGAVLCTPLISNNIIYFGSTDGNFYAVKTSQ